MTTPSAREALEEERDHLLASLRDLEREYEAGDLDAVDYRELKDDYTARTAAVLRALDEDAAPTPVAPAPAPPRSTARRLAVLGGVAAVAVVAGLFVAQSSGRRGTDGVLTGLDVRSATSRVEECLDLDASGATDEALDCYGEILEVAPQNVDALAYRGWLLIRNGEVAAGLVDLDVAVAEDPLATFPNLFRAVGLQRDGRSIEALDSLAAFYANDPAPAERELADQFAAPLVAAAVDGCVDGEVAGTLGAVAVLDCYRQAIEVDPTNATAHVYLGWLLARADQDERAAAVLDEGLRLDPDLSAGYVFRAALRAHTGDLDGARADLAAFDLLPDPPAEQVAAAAAVAAAVESGSEPPGLG